MWLFLPGPIVAAVAVYFMYQRLELITEFAPEERLATVGDLARYVAERSRPAASWERVRQVVARELRVDESRVAPEADLVRDLGC